jgi:hypothetical protein
VRAGIGYKRRLHYRSGDDIGFFGSSGERKVVSELPDPPPRTIQTTVAITAHADVTARATVTPFRVRLIEACSAALERLEAKSGPEHNIFAETGEVLFWLYAISAHDDDDGRPDTLSKGFRWARDNYGHGLLIQELHYTDHGAMPGGMQLGTAAARLGSPPTHCWKVVNSVRDDDVPDRHPDRLMAYNRRLPGRPVIATLRDEFARLQHGDPLPEE